MLFIFANKEGILTQRHKQHPSLFSSQWCLLVQLGQQECPTTSVVLLLFLQNIHIAKVGNRWRWHSSAACFVVLDINAIFPGSRLLTPSSIIVLECKICPHSTSYVCHGVKWINGEPPKFRCHAWLFCVLAQHASVRSLLGLEVWLPPN